MVLQGDSPQMPLQAIQISFNVKRHNESKSWNQAIDLDEAHALCHYFSCCTGLK